MWRKCWTHLHTWLLLLPPSNMPNLLRCLCLAKPSLRNEGHKLHNNSKTTYVSGQHESINDIMTWETSKQSWSAMKTIPFSFTSPDIAVLFWCFSYTTFVWGHENLSSEIMTFGQIGEVPNNKTSKNTVVSYRQLVNSSVGMYIYTPKKMNVSNWKGTILKGNNISRSSTWSSRLLDVLKTRRRLAHFSKGLRVHRFYHFESNKDPKQEHRVRTAEVTTNFNYAILRSQIPALLDLVDPEYLHQWQVASWCGFNSNAPFAHKVLELSWLWFCH